MAVALRSAERSWVGTRHAGLHCPQLVCPLAEHPKFAPLVTRLSADGIRAVDVPAKFATRVRVLPTGRGRKNDDAISVGVAALTAAGYAATPSTRPPPRYAPWSSTATT
jgi:hypothetical protein